MNMRLFTIFFKENDPDNIAQATATTAYLYLVSKIYKVEDEDLVNLINFLRSECDFDNEAITTLNHLVITLGNADTLIKYRDIVSRILWAVVENTPTDKEEEYLSRVLERVASRSEYTAHYNHCPDKQHIIFNDLITEEIAMAAQE